VGLDFGHFVGLMIGHLDGLGVFVGLRVLQVGRYVGHAVGTGGGQATIGGSFTSPRFSFSEEISTALRTLNRSRDRIALMIGDIVVLE
jgi:hypothetical protein